MTDIYLCRHTVGTRTDYMNTLRPINIKQGKTTNPNNSFFSEKKKKLLGWDSNRRHTACQADADMKYY